MASTQCGGLPELLCFHTGSSVGGCQNCYVSVYVSVHTGSSVGGCRNCYVSILVPVWGVAGTAMFLVPVWGLPELLCVRPYWFQCGGLPELLCFHAGSSVGGCRNCYVSVHTGSSVGGCRNCYVSVHTGSRSLGEVVTRFWCTWMGWSLRPMHLLHSHVRLVE